MIRITKLFTFEMAHALFNYDGPCANIHGHSYKLSVCVTGTPLQEENHPKNGMLIDYGDLKNIVNTSVISEMDHALVLNERMNKELIMELKKNFQHVVLFPFQPTNENLLTYFAGRIKAHLPGHVKLYNLCLYETETSFAEWFEDE